MTDLKQIRYTFSDEDIVEQDYCYTMYRLPYSPDIFWTHFQFDVSNGDNLFQIEILLITANGESHTLVAPMIRNPQQWYDTCWPLPSLPTSDHSGLYLKLIYPKVIQPGESDLRVSLSLLGFFGLFPSQMTYLLYRAQQCQFVFLHGKNSTIMTANSEADYESSVPLHTLSECPIDVH